MKEHFFYDDGRSVGKGSRQENFNRMESQIYFVLCNVNSNFITTEGNR